MVEQERAKGHLRAVRVTPKVILGPSHLIATCPCAHNITPPQTQGRSEKKAGGTWRHVPPASRSNRTGPLVRSDLCRSIHVVVAAVAGAAFLLLVLGQVGDEGVGGQQQ